MSNSGAGLIHGSTEKDLVLASETGSLRRLLEACGLAFRLMPLNLDEVATHQALLKNMGETDPADVAEMLTRAKIDEASARFPGALIIGAHQVISLNGKLLEKPNTIDAARDRLFELRDKTHELHSAVALAKEGQVTWTHVETAQLNPHCGPHDLTRQCSASIWPALRYASVSPDAGGKIASHQRWRRAASMAFT